MKKYMVLMVLSMSALVMTSCGNSAEEIPQEEIQQDEVEIGIAPGMKAPNFTLKDRNDEEITLSDYEGKVTFLNFWATTCPYCVEEMPDLEAFYNQHKDEDDFALLGINMTKTWEKKSKADLVGWLDKEGITFPNVFDVDGVQAVQWQARSLPVTFIIDPQGNSLGAIMGKTDLETLENILEEVRSSQE